MMAGEGIAGNNPVVTRIPMLTLWSNSRYKQVQAKHPYSGQQPIPYIQG